MKQNNEIQYYFYAPDIFAAINLMQLGFEFMVYPDCQWFEDEVEPFLLEHMEIGSPDMVGDLLDYLNDIKGVIYLTPGQEMKYLTKYYDVSRYGFPQKPSPIHHFCLWKSVLTPQEWRIDSAPISVVENNTFFGNGYPEQQTEDKE